MIRPKPLACPSCGSAYSRVIDARDAPRRVADLLRWVGGFWRLRKCESCGHRFTTGEQVIEDTRSSSSL